MDWAQQWGETLVESLRSLGNEIAGFIPNLIGMVVILLLGYGISRFVQRVSTAVLHRIGFDTAADKSGIRTLLQQVNIGAAPSEIVGRLVFWLFMLTFVISAADALGLGNVSQTVDSFVAYVPKVIGAAIVIVVGLMVAGLARDVVRGATERVGLDYARALPQLAYAVLVVIVLSLAIGQLGIETMLLHRVIEILLLAAGAALALALGLGTRDVTRNVVAGTYARDLYEPGMRISVGADEGSLVEVGPVSSKIYTEAGDTVFVPNGLLIETIVRSRGGGRP